MILASPIRFAAIYPAVVVAEGADGINDILMRTCLQSVTIGNRISYVKLEKWGIISLQKTHRQVLRAKAATETLYFDVVTDAANSYCGSACTQNGQYDIAEEIPANNYEELSKMNL